MYVQEMVRRAKKEDLKQAKNLFSSEYFPRFSPRSVSLVTLSEKSIMLHFPALKDVEIRRNFYIEVASPWILIINVD